MPKAKAAVVDKKQVATKTKPAVKKPAASPTRRNPKARNRPADPRVTSKTPLDKTKKSNLILPRGEFGLASYMKEEFDALAVKYEMIGGTRSLDRASTGSLVLDLILGGGITPTGMCIFAGGEGSGKTTTLTHSLGEALTVGLDYAAINDAENTLDVQYMQQSLGKAFDTDLLARLEYHDQNLIEQYFDFVRGVLRGVPDKVWSDDTNSFVYRLHKDNKSHLKLLGVMLDNGAKEDKKLSDRRYHIIPSATTAAQGFLALDSFPALITGKADERESDEGGGMSERARVLADILPKVAGRLRRKGFFVAGTNQLREKPGVMFGSPLYESMGNTFRYYTAQRTWFTTRAVEGAPGTWQKDKENGALCVEDNPLGGRDYYSFKGITNVKNKVGQPFLKGWMRIWTGDPDGLGRGIDPVFDCWEYLRMTGQVSGARTGKAGFKVLLPKHKDLAPMTWNQFKIFILAEKFGGKYAKTLRENGFSKQPKMLEECRAQLKPVNFAKPKAIELMAAARLAKSSSSKDDLSDDE